MLFNPTAAFLNLPVRLLSMKIRGNPPRGQHMTVTTTPTRSLSSTMVPNLRKLVGLSLFDQLNLSLLTPLLRCRLQTVLLSLSSTKELFNRVPWIFGRRCPSCGRAPQDLWASFAAQPRHRGIHETAGDVGSHAGKNLKWRFLSAAACSSSVSYTHLTLPTKRIV